MVSNDQIGSRVLGAPITLDQLRVFLRVAEMGSFSAAARSLRRAQSAVSYSVANLERLLDVTLFDRTGRAPALTEAGASLLADARGIELSVEQLSARARSMAEGVEPRVSLVVSVMVPMDGLVTAIGDFREAFPTVSLVLHTEALGAVAQMVLDGRCDLGVSEPLPGSLTSLWRAPIGLVDIVHVTAPSHPLAKRRGRIPSAALHGEVQLVLSDRSRLTEGVDHGVLSGRTWRLADLATKHAFLRAGFGWGGMPRHLVESDLKEGRLVRLRLAELGDEPFTVPLLAIHRGEEPPGPAGRWLLQRLEEGFAKASRAGEKPRGATTSSSPRGQARASDR